jgi:hypothetical protein
VSRDVAVLGRRARAALEGDPAGIDDHAALDAVRGAGLCVRRATERRRIAHALLATAAELEAANGLFVSAILVSAKSWEVGESGKPPARVVARVRARTTHDFLAAAVVHYAAVRADGACFRHAAVGPEERAAVGRVERRSVGAAGRRLARRTSGSDVRACVFRAARDDRDGKGESTQQITGDLVLTSRDEDRRSVGHGRSSGQPPKQGADRAKFRHFYRFGAAGAFSTPQGAEATPQHPGCTSRRPG